MAEIEFRGLGLEETALLKVECPGLQGGGLGTPSKDRNGHGTEMLGKA